METLSNLESFVRSAELGGFSAAARRLGLTPAAVSRNVAQLERHLGTRLFLRSTRRLRLTEAGERFLAAVVDGLDAIRRAIADVTGKAGQPAGVLRVSVAPAFGLEYVLPLLPAFVERYPDVVPDWSFDNRQVDLIADGFDAAIGGGIELTPGVVARELAPVHIVAVASPAFLARHRLPKQPSDLALLDGVVRRSVQSGRLRAWAMRNAKGATAMAEQKTRMIADDPAAMRQAAMMGLGVALIPLPHALTQLDEGSLVRVLPGWYVDAGAICLYYAGTKLLPAKTRAFVDHVVEAFRGQWLAQRFSAL